MKFPSFRLESEIILRLYRLFSLRFLKDRKYFPFVSYCYCSTWNKFDFIVCVCNVPRGTLLFYRPKYTNNTLISAGLTPGMRDACPIVAGLIRVSFWRDSIDNEFS